MIGLLLVPSHVLAAAVVENVVERTEKSVVRILSQGDPSNRCTWGTGTGFVINRRGHVVTNAHVITYELRKRIRIQNRSMCIPVDERGRPIVVMDSNHIPKMRNGKFIYIAGRKPIKRKSQAVFVLTGKKGFDQKVAARSIPLYDTLRDLAVLEVPDLRRPSVAISTAKARKGAQVISLGFPGIADAPARARLNDPSAFDGVISRIFEETKTHRWIVQHGAQIDKGNSGGPLFNTCNQVVGVNTYLVARRGVAAPVFFYSIYSITLAEQLRKNNIPFKAVNEPCVVSVETSAEVSKMIFSVSEMNKKTILWGGTSLGLAVLALLVSLRRPRERIVRVVESASRLVRKSRKEKGKDKSSGDSSDRGWVLYGFESDGRRVHLSFGETQLRRSGKGLVIGRDPKLSHLIVSDSTVSRRHARIVWKDGAIGLEDLNSLNGSFVNGENLKPFDLVILEIDSSVAVGSVNLTFSRA